MELPANILLHHLYALILMWGICLLAGSTLARFLPITLQRWDRLVLIPLLGAATLAALFYLIPFGHGLYVAFAVMAVLAIPYGSTRRNSRPFRPREWLALGLLGVAGLAYATPLLVQFVPLGMDASMYAYNARVIGASVGLPENYAPFAAEVPFSGVNQGLAVLAGLAVAFGATPVSAVLAGSQFSFMAAVLGLTLLCRLVVRPLPAVVIAVASCFFARNAQATLEWGGFPNILAVGVGLAAARLLIDQLRKGTLRTTPAVGILIGAIPILHGLSAASWLFLAAPLSVMVGLFVSRHRQRGLQTCAVAAVIAGSIVLAYLAGSSSSLAGPVGELIRDLQKARGPQGTGWQLVGNGVRFLAAAADWTAFSLAMVGVVTLVMTRQWQRLSIAILGLSAILIVVLNSQWGVLPATRLLWPERVVFWSGAWVGVTLALALRPLRLSRLQNLVPNFAPVALAALLILLAGTRHNHYFQRKAVSPVMSREAWDVLVKTGTTLDPATDFVWSVYGSEAAYLPAVAGIATNAWHVNCIHLQSGDVAEKRREITHFLFVDPAAMRLSKARRNVAGDMLAEYARVRDTLQTVILQSESVRLYRMEKRVAALSIDPSAK